MIIYKRNNLWYIAVDGLLFVDNSLDYVLSVAIRYKYKQKLFSIGY